MQIVITGVSSFSGAWFAKEITNLGHEVFGYTRDENNLSELQRERINWISNGAPNFKMISSKSKILPSKIDRLCLHGTATLDYRSPNFDIEFAVESTLEQTKWLVEKFGRPLTVHTGTFSEESESFGESPLRSFNLYSSSKTLIFEEHSRLFGEDTLLKYVMPNPYGPFEPKKFTDYLLKNWAVGVIPVVNTPNYVRDNVPIDLLARHYAEVVTNEKYFSLKRIYPSKYIETVRAFAERYATNVNLRSGNNYTIKCTNKHEYTEPRIRVNRDYCEDIVMNWDEESSWDQVVENTLTRIVQYKTNP